MKNFQDGARSEVFAFLLQQQREQQKHHLQKEIRNLTTYSTLLPLILLPYRE